VAGETPDKKLKTKGSGKMEKIAWDKLANVEETEIGQVAIFLPMGNTMAVAETLAAAIEQYNNIADMDQQITEDDLAEYGPWATNETLCYAEVSEADSEED
jgi:hypothetical protein